MAELHVIGEIVGGVGFEASRLFCRWGAVSGRNWDLLEGIEQGQTHIDYPEEGEFAVWSHPIDLHYACRGIVGWPKLHFQVWGQDAHGRNEICGYGFCHVPTAPGQHEIKCTTWCPEGTKGEQLSSFFVGGAPRLKLEEVCYNGGDRYRLQTKSSGLVVLKLSIIMKDFAKHGVVC